MKIVKKWLKTLQNKKINDQGFTLIELMVVLFIIGILTAAGLRAVTSSVQSSRVTAVVKDVTTLMNAAHAYAGNTAGQLSGTYYGLSSITGGGYTTAPSLLPKSYTTSGMQNAFGGFGTLNQASNAYQYMITETGIPTDACTEIMAKLSSLQVTPSCSSGGTLTVLGQ